MDVAGRLILITGASSGIGAATALAAACAGAKTILLARGRDRLETVAAQVRAGAGDGSGGAAWVYPVDLADASAVAEVAPRIIAEAGLPDVLILSAGAGRWLFVEETPPAEAATMLAAPYFAAFYTVQAFLPAML